MKVVTVGTSTITSRLIQSMKDVGIEIYACVSRDLQKAKEFADKNRVERYADNYDKVLKSNEFDFVYIGLPNSLHFEYAKKALENGKNVIVEKPICLNQKQLSELISLALRKKLFIFENMRVYHTLAYKTLSKYIDQIKPIRMIDMNYSKYSSRYDAFKAGMAQTAISNQYGSGALMDLGCYNISFVIGLFGLPISSTYVCNITENIDNSGTAILKYKDFMVNLTSGKDGDSLNYLNITGENGYIELMGDPSFVDRYNIHYKDGTVKKVEYREPDHFSSTLRDMKSIYENNDTRKYDYFMKLSLMEMKVMDELRKSANIKFAAEN